MNKQKFLIILGSICLLLSLIFFYEYKIKYYHIDNKHIFIDDNKNEDSNFDKYLKETLDISFVPTYIIVYNNKILKTVQYTLNVAELEEEIGTAIMQSELNKIDTPELSSEVLIDLNGNTVKFNELFNFEGLSLFEVHMAGCKDCELQDVKFEQAIRRKFKKIPIYRYYIKSELEEVKEIKH